MNLVSRVFVIAIGLLLAGACHSTPGSDQALLARLEQEILGQPLAGKVVYLSRKTLHGGDVVPAWRFRHTVPADFGVTTFVFVDEQPDANWEHAARFIFIDQASGRFRVVPVRTAPDDLASMQRLN
jgi:hypothetical protein